MKTITVADKISNYRELGKIGLVSHRSIERLSLYRRLLGKIGSEEQISSGRLASMANVKADQVRRDLMVVQYTGCPRTGYSVQGLIHSISQFLDASQPERAVLVGAGKLGQAILAYCMKNPPRVSIVAVFDQDRDKIGRKILDCPCYGMDELARVVGEHRILTGVITVPAEAAQEVAEELIGAGVRGIMNFAPVILKVPVAIHLENIDLAITLEKLAFLSYRSEL